MNIKIIVTGILCSMVSVGGWAASIDSMGMEKAAKASAAAQPDAADIAVAVNGMVCSFCAQGITKKFKAMPQVDAVDVRLGEARVYLTLKKGEQLDDKTIEKTLTQAGYNVEKIYRRPS